jgi:hypothetical protein
MAPGGIVIYAPHFQDSSHFAQWSRKAVLMDAALCQTVDEMSNGLIDAELGSNVLSRKRRAASSLLGPRGGRAGRSPAWGLSTRVAMPGRGKSAGARVLVATRKGDRWFFVFGFERNERASVSPTELEALQEQARALLALSGVQLDAAVEHGALQEVCHAGQAEGEKSHP